ncbi:MAG TPA: metallophosphoesterase [Candidatus Hydrogenedentes bacterium]|nr:metallophosphoesterase [Candidatus Hydrogenedentota bacterium]HQH54439.1 metallophosphoesterase [Candidatus Hydrogenedentota bacterium]
MRRTFSRTPAVVAGLLILAAAGLSQEQEHHLGGRGQLDAVPMRAKELQRGPSSVFYTGVPAHDFDIILGRPTGHCITLSILGYIPMDGYVAYGTAVGDLVRKTKIFPLGPGQPQEVLLDELTPGTQHYYQLYLRRAGTDAFVPDETCTFHTQRTPGTSFTFTVQADSHLDSPESPELYARALRSALGDAPDFHIDLGDTFMTDKRKQDYQAALPQYLAQRYYFGLLCHSAPLFLVLGNHDGEFGQRFSAQGDCIAGWSNAIRKRLFPNPVPNDFYAGNDTPFESLGLLEDYYAWKWGGALFVVLDPYWYTTTRAHGAHGQWNTTLGEEQYRWLESTLKDNTAAFKFVFIHNLVGGTDVSMRGGAEAARYGEWGGHDWDGRHAFQEQRPGWGMPVHALLARYGVNVVFHGHDHFFARQELDGVIYQLVPQPSRSGGRGAARMAAEYGYVQGDFLASPGYLRVNVDKALATVSYVRTPVTNRTDGAEGGSQVAFEYRIPARAQQGQSRTGGTADGTGLPTSQQDPNDEIHAQ